MNIARIKNFNISNGKGVGVSVYVSGCHFHCKGCFNSETWDPNYGKPFTDEVMAEIMSKLGNPNIDHLSVLGGEPLDPGNIEMVKFIIETAKSAFPDKKVWLWTGYEKKNLTETQKEVVALADYVTYGQFIEAKKNIRRKYSGSDNQFTEDRFGNIIEAAGGENK